MKRIVFAVLLSILSLEALAKCGVFENRSDCFLREEKERLFNERLNSIVPCKNSHILDNVRISSAKYSHYFKSFEYPERYYIIYLCSDGSVSFKSEE